MKIKNKIKQILKNLIMKRGIKTNRQIVVFESDDWGAVRNSSLENLNKLKLTHPDFKFDHYQSLDILETDEDILSLIKILKKHKDSKGNCAKFTLNFATANPDFKKIKENGNSQFIYEPITSTYNKSTNSQNVIEIVKNGIKENVLMPQLHSREHLNCNMLIKSLKENSFVAESFEYKIVGLDDGNYKGLDCLCNCCQESKNILLQDAYELFEKTFGFKSKTFIAPCYVWNTSDEKCLSELGVEYLQGKLYQNIPIAINQYKRKLHNFGERNKSTNLIYGIRNCQFEPSRERFAQKSEEEIIETALKEIETAFKNKKPAVICTHRVNFVSGMSESNRTKNLELLDKLLSALEEKYENLEFMTSDELLNMIKEKNFANT